MFSCLAGFVEPGESLEGAVIREVHDATGTLVDPHTAVGIGAARIRREGGSPMVALATAATVIDGRGAEAMFTDGPFVETKEWLSGFWVIEAADLDVALKLAAAGSKACNRRVEVRPFL